MSSGDLAIVARGISKSFGPVQAVRALDLDVPRRQIFGFLGPNGSGKSTTIRMLCGLLTPDAGDIDVLGHRVPQDAEALRMKVGYMTQKFSLYGDLSVAENLNFIADIYTLPRSVRRRRLDEAAERYRLGGLMAQRAETLSGGQKQRLALAAATLHEPELLFLDEPTSAVDPENRRAFWETLFDLIDEGTTILVSTHYMDEAERCHRLAILDEGRLVAAGAPDRLAADIDAEVVRIVAPRPRAVQRWLETVDGVRSTAQIGHTLRVLLDPARDDWPGHLRALADARGFSLEQCERATASLEDVFVAATRDRLSQPEAA